jgi:hypothetical protein
LEKLGGKQTTLLALLQMLQDVCMTSWPFIAHLVSSTFDTPWALALYVTLLPVVLL